MRRRAIFRFDASAELGTGHLFRCRTLASALANLGWEIGFACSASTLSVAPALAAHGHRVVTMPVDVTQEPEAMRRAWQDGADALIVDHYRRDHVYETNCRPWAKRVVAIDDAPRRRHNVDMLLDQTLGSSADKYREWVPECTRLAVGGDYILLRQKIRDQRRSAVSVSAVAHNIVVTFGSSDTRNLSARSLVALADPRLKDMAAWLVVGPGNSRHDELLAASPPNVRIVVNPANFAEIVAGADIALSAAGTTCWELAYLGVPSILVTQSLGNVAQSLEAVGAARWLGYESEVNAGVIADALVSLASDRGARQTMADAGRRAVDGKGAERAAAAIEDLVCR